jgi:DnaJ-class molecular chaperone
MKRFEIMLRSAAARRIFILAVAVASVVALVLQVMWMQEQRPAFTDSAIGLHSRMIKLQTQRIICEHCGGSGLVRDPADPEKTAVCPLCFGLGMNRVRQLSDYDLMCTVCRGMGRRPGEAFNLSQPCEACGGRGLKRLEKERFKIYAKQVQCEHCESRGVVESPENPAKLELCPICFGLGSHLVRPLDEHDVLCPACGGLGRLYDADSGLARDCRRCLGRGMIVESPDAKAAAVQP